MSNNAYDFYGGGNTARGYTSLLPSSLKGLERLCVVRGGPGLGKRCELRSISDKLSVAGHEVWRIACASDPDALDALIVPGLSLGIVDGTTPNAIVPEIVGATVVEFDLGEACDKSALSARESEMASLDQEIADRFAEAYAGFAEALRVHDDWEKIYIGNMDFQKADELTQECIDRLIGDRKGESAGREAHRFLGAATPLGAVDYVPGLTEGLKRYLLKGRPGSGKSTMLKKLAAAAAERGFDSEIYHCGFDPNSLDMVVVRELGFAIFDSTAPHEYFPDRPSDEIVDMYERCIVPGTDEAHADELAPIRQQYAANMKRSIGLLAEARALRDQLERLYAETVDSSAVERIVEEFRRNVLGFASIQV